jgi:hypothetical protein
MTSASRRTPVTTATSQAQLPPAAAPTGSDDPFHDPVLIGIGVAFVVIALVILILTGIHVWGNLYDAPSWSSHAYPPAVAH